MNVTNANPDRHARATMAASVHTPERLEGESFADYRERRQKSKRIAKALLRGFPVPMHIGHGRRPVIKAAGGIRQFKRSLTEHLRD